MYMCIMALKSKKKKNDGFSYNIRIFISSSVLSQNNGMLVGTTYR